MVKPTLAPGSKAMVGRNLRWVREIVSPSMSDCARMLGVEVGTWSLWELGKRYPDPAAKVRFCTSTGVTMDFLYRSDAGSRGRCSDSAGGLSSGVGASDGQTTPRQESGGSFAHSRAH